MIESDEIKRRVAELGEEISRNHEGHKPILVTVLKGGAMFASDLTKELSIPIETDSVSVSSYKKSTSGPAKIVKDLAGRVKGRHVVVVENIVDSGSTLERLLKELKDRGAASVEVCCLLDKKTARKHDIDIKYKGFLIDDKFVVGYGLDYNQEFRNLPDIMLLEK